MPTIPEGDVLIHAGYCMGSGSLPQTDAFTKWMGAQPHGRKIIIARKIPALGFCLFNETHKDGLAAHDQKALRPVPRRTTWQEIDTTNWPLGVAKRTFRRINQHCPQEKLSKVESATEDPRQWCQEDFTLGLL